MFKKYLAVFLLFIFQISYLVAQKKSVEKYPSLLWEITGNGLTRPSYLFGTMHVSNKLAFHLSDSFYYALKNVDEVALELNPEVWQGQMARLERLKNNYSSFVQQAGNDFITENSFRLNDYVEELTTALRTEPSIVNNLLYRSYKTREDFEEDTFLDLYIYQTGRKLGKRSAGVEDYYQAEKLVLEAYGDMAREKKKKNLDFDGDNMREIFEQAQNAYRRGDLDLMDSLDYMMEHSDAFREKFLFKRNEIQANSIDSIIKKASLFAGVGAAHLPGNRGVIELLRLKGYILRPIKMTDRDGTQKNDIDNLKVPVIFQNRSSDDQLYSVNVPGELYKISQDYQALDRRQYADMSNGAYYIVTRVKTYASFLNQGADKVMKKVDSVLYENIPGKILSRRIIERNKYPGYDITAKNRRGDLQRYNIFISPFEIFIFKMSGKENYISGTEAEQFFSSIRFKEQSYNKTSFEPLQGGFEMRLPQEPHQYFNNNTRDSRWEYEAVDKTNGNAYLILKKSVYNFNHIDDDNFTLALMEESFHNDKLFNKQQSRRTVKFNGKEALEVKEKLKDGSLITVIFYIMGPHYFVIAERGNTNSAEFMASFNFKPYRYQSTSVYTDSFINAKVTTKIIPEIDDGLRRIIEQSEDDLINGNTNSGYVSYWPKIKNAVFKSDSTGEMISVQVQAYPKYFYIKDSAKYWANEINELRIKNDMLISSINYLAENFGIKVSLMDTGSSRIINKLILVRNNHKYSITAISDSLEKSNEFYKEFYSSFMPFFESEDLRLYESRLPRLFEDLFSNDSILQTRARQAIPNIYYGIAGVKNIKGALQKLNITNKDYYETKSNLIAELGYIIDSTGQEVVPLLKMIYNLSTDTSLFQNEVVKALARQKTKPAYYEIKKILLQDPPIFDNNYDLSSLFTILEDSLELCRDFFPDILQLTTLDDYKNKVLSLLVKLVDSNFINKNAYKKYYSNILTDARVSLKKQKNRDVKRKQEEINVIDNEPLRIFHNNKNSENQTGNYAVLLIPFYDKKEVQLFFKGLLGTEDEKGKLNSILLMLRNNIHVPDSLIFSMAANDKTRGHLYNKLVKNNLTYKFPLQFSNQLDLSRSYVTMENEYDRMDTVIYLSKLNTTYKGEQGNMYFFKYRIQQENDWKIAMSGPQPVNEMKIVSEPIVSLLTEVKINETELITEQLATELKKILFTFYKSGRNFYTNSDTPPF